MGGRASVSGHAVLAGDEQHGRHVPDGFRSGQGVPVRGRDGRRRRRSRERAVGNQEPTVRELGDVLRRREIGLARRVEPGDPTPGKGVRGGIAVEQVMEEEVGAERPGQLQREDPDRGEPHPRVVVQRAGFDQLACPMVERLDPRFARAGGLVAGALVAVALDLRKLGGDLPAVIVPNLRPLLQPAFPVGAPDDLLHELLGHLRAVRIERRAGRLGLEHEPPPDPGRKVGNVVRGPDRRRSRVLRRSGVPCAGQRFRAVRARPRGWVPVPFFSARRSRFR